MTQTVTLGGATGGTSAIELPLVGFGTWRLRGQEAYDATRYALEVGYRHIDTATMYGNEAEVGRALRDSGVPRGQVFITTKLPPERAGQEQETLDRSLHDLGVDHVDLWLIHWPPSGAASPAVWRQFIAARDAGRTRVIGVSNYSIAQIDQLIDTVGEGPSVNQVPFSPFEYEAEFVVASRKRGILVEGYSPLRRSDLGNPVLVEIAERHGVTVPQVVLRWHLEHGIPVIPKSSRKERIEANFDLFGFALDDDEVARIDALGRG
jgi:diketogulonate reductase-like aldo/keto reductase